MTTEQPPALQGAPKLKWKYMSYDGDNWTAGVDGKNAYHITSWKEGSFFCDHDSKNDHPTLEAAKAWCQQHYEDTLRKNDPWSATPPTENIPMWIWNGSQIRHYDPLAGSFPGTAWATIQSFWHPHNRWMPAQLPSPPKF